MKQAVLPPQAIPVDFENIEHPDIWESAPVRRKRKIFRSLFYGFIVGVPIPFAIAGGTEVAKELDNIRVTSKTSEDASRRFPILKKLLGQAPTDDAADSSEEAEEAEIVTSNIPKDIRVTINKHPEITDAHWNDPILSCKHGGTDVCISFTSTDNFAFSGMTFGNTDIRLSQPITLPFLPRVLNNVSHVKDNIKAQRMRTTHLISPDGARFEFTTRKQGRIHQYVGAATGMYRRTSQPSAPEKTLEDITTHTTISEEQKNNGETQWYYTKNGKSIFDVFSAHTLLQRWEFPSSQETMLTEFHPGTIVPRSITVWKEKNTASGSRQKENVLERFFLPDGREYRRNNRELMRDEYFDKNGRPLAMERYEQKEEIVHGIRYLTRKNIAHVLYHEGQEVRLYPDQKRLEPNLTPKQYLKRLAHAVGSHQALHFFIGQYRFWEYVYDSPDPRNPLLKGTEQNHSNYIQTAEETVQRVENRKMLGDCDDLATLAKELTHTLGIRSQCIKDDGHVFCAWIEQCDNGKYNGKSIDFDGIRTNGEPYSITEDNGQGMYDSPKEAFEATLKAYPKARQYHPLPLVTVQTYHPRYNARKVHVRTLVSRRSAPLQVAQK